MKNKVLLYSIVVMCLILLILASVLLLKSKKNASVLTDEASSNNPATLNCNPYTDIIAAAKTGDLSGCNCLTDVTQKGICLGNLSDAAIYTKALKESNLSLCSNISLIGMKDACLRIVNQKISFANQSGSLPATTTNKIK